MNDGEEVRDLIETMRFDPEGGIADLDMHLERLLMDAAALGFSFNRHDARNELQAATFRRKEPATLRMMVSPKGSIAIELRGLEP